MNCKKVPFGSEFHIERFLYKKQPTFPTYNYRCPICGYWHYTKKKPPPHKESTDREKFLSIESEYWQHKIRRNKRNR